MASKPTRTMTLAAWLLFAPMVVGAACSQTRSEGVCVSPRLAVFPTAVQPGDSLTVSWVGNLLCEGEPIEIVQEGGLQLTLDRWVGSQTPEPYTTPPLIE